MILKFRVYEQTISLQSTKSEPRQGSRDYLELQFSFSSDWNDLSKYVYLQSGDVSVPHDLVEGSVIVDEYFTEQTEFNVTLFGKSADGSVEVPTNVITVFLKESNNLWEKDAPEPQNSWVVQVIDARDEALAAAIRAENAAIHQPYPNSETGTWWVWNAETGKYEDTGDSYKGESSVQSDWNQNDDTQPDYVKNRPFYTGDPVETVLVEESTVTFTENNGLYMASFPVTFEVSDDMVGETWKISWDGTVYECPFVDANGIPVIGNLSIAGQGSDTGEPFVMAIVSVEEIKIFTADTSASHTFSISRMVIPVVKIDEKYLPTQKVTFTKSEYNDGALSDTMSDAEVLDSVVLNIPVLKVPIIPSEPIVCTTGGELILRKEYISYGTFNPHTIEINSNTLTSETFELVIPYGDVCMLRVIDIYTKTKCHVYFPMLHQSGADSSVGAISQTFTQSVAYINGHLFAFCTSSLSPIADRTITLTVKKIL